MSEDKNSLVNDHNDSVSTDIVTDLKSGIYNLFVALINHQIAFYGPEKALELSVQYLKNIVENFEGIINNTDQE